jgi:hypothetical protein
VCISFLPILYKIFSLESWVLALWWGINASIPKIIGLGIYFGINPQTLKEIASSPKTPTPQGLKTHTYPALKDEACPVVMDVGGFGMAVACDFTKLVLGQAQYPDCLFLPPTSFSRVFKEMFEKQYFAWLLGYVPG